MFYTCTASASDTDFVLHTCTASASDTDFVLHTCTASASDTAVTRELSVGTGGLNLGGGGLDTRVTIPSILAPIVAVMGIVISTITAVCVHRRRTNKIQGNTFDYNEAV